MYSLVYLAGPITGLSYGDATDWRTYVAERLSEYATPISPMREKEYLATETEIQASYEDSLFSNKATFTMRDRYDVERSDVVFANVQEAEKVSVGTVLEIGMAVALGIPVVLVTDGGNPHNHPMLEQLVRGNGTISADLDAAIDVVNWLVGVGV